MKTGSYNQWREVGSVAVSVLVIFVLGGMVYSNTLDVPFVLDDIYSIVNSEARRSINVYWSAWLGTRTIPYFTLDVNYALGGLDVGGYHVVNILVHLVTSSLAFGVVYKLAKVSFDEMHIKVGEVVITNHIIVGLVAGLLFAVHPIQTQGVTYVVQRIASIATMFYLLALLAYAFYRTSRLRWTRYGWAGLSLIATVMAMHSKEIAITLPVAIVLMELMFFSQSWRMLARRWWKLLPWVLTLLIIPAYMLGLRDLFIHIPTEPSSMSGETLFEKVTLGRIGSVSAETRDVSRWDYLMTQFGVVVLYIKLLFIPIGQNIDHDISLKQTFWDYKVIGPLLLWILMIGLSVWAWVKNKKMVAFGILLFFIGLLPESSIVPITDVNFEHRTYLPFIGFALVIGGIVQFVLHRYQEVKIYGVRASRLVLSLIVIVVISLAVLSYARNSVWKDSLALWQDAVAKSPNKARPLNNLGLAYMDANSWTEAEEVLERAVVADPEGEEALVNLGSLYGQRGRNKQAEEVLLKALEINPESGSAYNNLGNVYLQQKKYDQAIDVYSLAAQGSRGRDGSGVWASLGDAYIGKQQTKKAIEAYEKAVFMYDSQADWFNRLGALYAMSGEYVEAEKALQRAIELEPTMEAAKQNLRKLRTEK